MLFFIYAILGWIIETTLVSIEKKKFVNRGFLIGPYCPIYGFGGLAITILLKNYTKDPIVLFLMAVIICACLEYFTSYIMEKLFKARWWDYSKKKYNINGRICLETIIPTLYRYYKEDYRVNFIDSEENSLPIYISVTGENINYFDVDEEVNRSEPWIGSQENFKENIDKIVENVLIANYKNREFEEIYSTKIISTSDTETVKDENQKEKIVITYKLLDKSS